MRCDECGQRYEPGPATGACPHCGCPPPAPRGRRPARSLQQLLDGPIALAVFIAGFLVLPILTLLTGQLLLGGSLILLLLGGYTILYSARGNLRNLARPWQAATLGHVLGILMVGGGIGCMVWYARSGPAWPSLTGPQRLFGGGWRNLLTALVPLGVVASTSLVGALLDLLWSRAEAAQREMDGQAGPVYPIPPTFRAACITAILLISMVECVMLAAATNPQRSHVSVASGVGIFLLFCPIVAFLSWMISHNSGHVVLTGDAVVLVRLWSRRSMPYRDIVRMDRPRPGRPVSLVLGGKKGRLRIPRSVINLAQLELNIRWRVQHASPPQTEGVGHG